MIHHHVAITFTQMHDETKPEIMWPLILFRALYLCPSSTK